jgi:hypothetical protein
MSAEGAADRRVCDQLVLRATEARFGWKLRGSTGAGTDAMLESATLREPHQSSQDRFSISDRMIAVASSSRAARNSERPTSRPFRSNVFMM